MKKKPSEKSLFTRLRERRFFQFVLSYLVASWGILQFLDWLVNRYSLSSHWVDMIFLFLLVMLPSVIVITYYHGRPGRDTWGKAEKIVLPTNLVLAFVLIVALSQGQYLGKTADTITVTDEEGVASSRRVPKRAFTQRLALFPLENKTESADLDWFSPALAHLLGSDLDQDIQLTTLVPLELERFYTKYDYQYGQPLPFSIQRQIAEDAYTDRFFTGEFSQEAGNFTITINIYNTENGKLVTTHEAKGSELIPLVDKLTQTIIQDQELPDVVDKNAEYIDLPVSDLYSDNTAALEAYFEGMKYDRILNQPEKSIPLFQKGVELDADFAECYLSLGKAFDRLNQQKEAEIAIEESMAHISTLPERQQFKIRYEYYYFQGDLEKASALLEMWRQLYPSTYNPYLRLMQIYSSRGEVDRAKKVGLEALEAGHTSRILLDLAYISTLQGRTDEALEYYEQFAEKFPEKAQELSQIGEIYLKQGEFEKAKEHFDRILLLKPNDHALLGNRARVSFHQGNFRESHQFYQKALSKAKTAKDSAAVLLWESAAYQTQGKVKKSIELMEERWRIMESFLTPYEIGSDWIAYHIILMYTLVGQEDQLQAKVAEYFDKYPDQNGIITCAFQVNYYIALEEPELFNEVWERCEPVLQPLAGTTQLKMIHGFHAYLNQDYQDAAIKMEEYLRETGLEDTNFNNILGDIYRLGGQYEKAEKALKSVLVFAPQDGQTYLVLAKTYLDQNQFQEAEKWLKKCLELWEQADPEFKPAKEAQDLLSGI